MKGSAATMNSLGDFPAEKKKKEDLSEMEIDDNANFQPYWSAGNAQHQPAVSVNVSNFGKNTLDSLDDLDSLSDISTDSGGDQSEQKSPSRTKGGRTSDPSHAATKSGQASSSAAGGSGVDLSTKAKNRQHAKNTRIRKKNYVESLKETLHSFNLERDRVDNERRAILARLADQVRYLAMIYL